MSKNEPMWPKIGEKVAIMKNEGFLVGIVGEIYEEPRDRSSFSYILTDCRLHEISWNGNYHCLYAEARALPPYRLILSPLLKHKWRLFDKGLRVIQGIIWGPAEYVDALLEKSLISYRRLSDEMKAQSVVWSQSI